MKWVYKTKIGILEGRYQAQSFYDMYYILWMYPCHIKYVESENIFLYLNKLNNIYITRSKNYEQKRKNIFLLNNMLDSKMSWTVMVALFLLVEN